MGLFSIFQLEASAASALAALSFPLMIAAWLN